MNRFLIPIALVDVLFNLMWVCMAFWLISFINVNPVAVEEVPANSQRNAEFIIQIQWPDESRDDVDSWLRTPSGKYVSYISPQVELFHLELDDRGSATDFVALGNTVKTINSNQETISLRGFYEGTYTFNLFMYMKNSEEPSEVTVKFIKLNPTYTVLYESKVIMTKRNQEESMFTFYMTDKGEVKNLSNIKSYFIKNEVQSRRDNAGDSSISIIPLGEQ